MDGLRRFIAVDNCSAVDEGGLRSGTTSLPVQKLRFNEAFPGAIIREGADELTLRDEQVAADALLFLVLVCFVTQAP